MYKLRNFNKAKLDAKRRKRENRKMVSKSLTYRAIGAWQDYSLTIHTLTDTIQFEGQRDNEKDPLNYKWTDSSVSRKYILILFNCL